MCSIDDKQSSWQNLMEAKKGGFNLSVQGLRIRITIERELHRVGIST